MFMNSKTATRSSISRKPLFIFFVFFFCFFFCYFFSLATSEVYKNKEGELKGRTEWHQVVVKSPAVSETMAKILKKGTVVWVDGPVETHEVSCSVCSCSFLNQCFDGACFCFCVFFFIFLFLLFLQYVGKDGTKVKDKRVRVLGYDQIKVVKWPYKKGML